MPDIDKMPNELKEARSVCLQGLFKVMYDLGRSRTEIRWAELAEE